MISIIFEEIKYFVLKNTTVALLLIFAFSFSFIAINITLTDFINASKEQTAAEETYGNKTFYKVIFTGEDEVVNRLMSDEYKENIKKLYDSLKKCSLFDYSYTLVDSMLFYNENDDSYSSDDFPPYKKECLLGYEEGDADFYESENVLTLKAIYASPDFMDEQHITLSSGNWFKTEDFTVSNPNSIVLPVLLGSAYEDIYQVGDEIKNAHPGTNKGITLSVVGFLNENSYFYDNNNEKTILNRYMIIPNCDISYNYILNDGSYESFFSDMYDCFDKVINARIICSKENADAASKMFYEILNENKLYELSLFDETSGMNKYLSALKDQAISCTIIAVFITLLSVIMFCFQIYNNIRKNQKKYGIYMINGITSKQLFIIMLSNSLTIFILSDLLLFILYSCLNNGIILDLGQNDYTIMVLATIEIVLSMFMSVFGLLRIKKMNLCTMLRENE